MNSTSRLYLSPQTHLGASLAVFETDKSHQCNHPLLACKYLSWTRHTFMTATLPDKMDRVAG